MTSQIANEIENIGIEFQKDNGSPEDQEKVQFGLVVVCLLTVAALVWLTIKLLQLWKEKSKAKADFQRKLIENEIELENPNKEINQMQSRLQEKDRQINLLQQELLKEKSNTKDIQRKLEEKKEIELENLNIIDQLKIDMQSYLQEKDRQINLLQQQYESSIQAKDIQIRNLEEQKKNLILKKQEVLQVYNQQEQDIWNLIVKQKFEARYEHTTLNSYFTKNSNLMIEINGTESEIKRIKSEVQSDLKLYKSVDLELTSDKSYETFRMLVNSNWKNCFGNIFNEMQSLMGDTKFQIEGYFIKNNQKGGFRCKVIYNDRIINLESIKKVFGFIFLDQIEIFIYDTSIEQILLISHCSSKEQFEKEFQIIIKSSFSCCYFVGLASSIQQIKSLLMKQQKEEIHLKHHLIHKQMKQFVLQKKISQLQSFSNAEVQFENYSMKISGNQESKHYLEVVMKEVLRLNSSLVSAEFNLNQMQLNSLDRLKHEIQEIENKFNCQIENKSQENIVFRMQADKKSLSLVHGDISNVTCDAIVNSWRNVVSFKYPQTFGGLSKSILYKGGIQYQKFCKNKYGKENNYIYEMPKNYLLKYIINVVTPIIDQSDSLQETLDSIKQNIIQIFSLANLKSVQSLAIPILGCGSCTIAFQEIIMENLNQIIEIFFNENCKLTTVVIVEINQTRIDLISKNLEWLVNDSRLFCMKYLWQWQDNDNCFQNYDLDKNRQIDEAYKLFLQDSSKNETLLNYSYSTKPGTHRVDLKKQQITNLEAKHLTQKLSWVFENNQKKFLINNQQVNQSLNKYLILQELLNNQDFTIFYKEFKILFQDGDKIFQKNCLTNYKRCVRKVELGQMGFNRQNLNRNILNETKFQLSNYKFNTLVPTTQLRIISFSRQSCLDAVHSLETLLQNHFAEKEIIVPNFFDEEFEKFLELFQDNLIHYEGSLTKLAQIKIWFNQQHNFLFLRKLSDFLNEENQFPISWILQDDNMIKVMLSSQDQDYQTVSDIFSKSDKGQIHRIYRIQNKKLWINYISAKKDLLKNQRELQKLEYDRYLWHGVKGQHPKVIYQSDQVGFDSTFAKQGSFGNGIYFAENANYSRGYSYKLNGVGDDSDLQGKLVFLCCKVATGKLEKRSSNQNIKQPSEGFDCVTDGNNQFVLYGLSTRRAYPAYEVIFS